MALPRRHPDHRTERNAHADSFSAVSACDACPSFPGSHGTAHESETPACETDSEHSGSVGCRRLFLGFQFGTRPWARRDWTWTGLRSLPGAGLGRGVGAPHLFRTFAVHGQPESGRTRPVAQHWQVDAAHGTITIPLYKGTVKGTPKTIWYILTDVSDQGVAQELGLNFSAKLDFDATTLQELATWTRTETSSSIKARSISPRNVTS